MRDLFAIANAWMAQGRYRDAYTLVYVLHKKGHHMNEIRDRVDTSPGRQWARENAPFIYDHQHAATLLGQLNMEMV